jgi:hypothetical protein
MSRLARLLAFLKAKVSGGAHGSKHQPHHHFPSLPPKRDRNRHSQREFRHRDRSLAPDPEADRE